MHSMSVIFQFVLCCCCSKKVKGVLIVPEGPYGPVPVYGWLRGPAVEHWSLADVLSLSCAQLVADG